MFHEIDPRREVLLQATERDIAPVLAGEHINGKAQLEELLLERRGCVFRRAEVGQVVQRYA